MKKNLIDYLICPVCKAELTLKIFQENKEEVEDGLMTCSCGEFFPIIKYIPRILGGDLREMMYSQFPDFFIKYKSLLPMEKLYSNLNLETIKKRETSESFGYEWKKFSEMIKEWKANFDFYFEPAKDFDFSSAKIVLEVGCGKGRHTFYVSKIAHEVVAVDFSRAIDVARENNKNSTNVHFVQSDIYHLPFRKDYFDFIFCIGVLHHLPTPEEGFKKIVDMLKENGGMLIYVYHQFLKGSFNYYLLKFVNFFRRLTIRINHKILYLLCYPIGFLSYLFFVLPYKIFIKNLNKENWPLKSYSEYPFKVLLNDTFDRFSAPIENRYSKEEIVAWYGRAGFKNTKILGGAGWRLFGNKISE